MGTNYYSREETCAHCHSFKERHIGKSSYGWEFSFYAINEDRLSIHSWMEWRAFLKQKGIKIFNEYDEEVSFDEFVKIVEERGHPSGKLLNHYEYCLKEHPEHAAKDLFLDTEGYSFSRGEFA